MDTVSKCMDTVSKSKLSLLELVYPPISNQEAVWLQHDPDVEKHMRESDFHMIAARTEAKFSDIIIDEDTHILRLEFTVGHKLSRSVRIHLRELPGIASENVQGYLVEAGEKGISGQRRSQAAN
jgi:hypothetical protein